MGNGSAAAADGDCGRVGGIGGKGDVRLAAAGNAGKYGIDVVGIGAGKQGRKREVDVAGFVGVENVSAIGRTKPPTVLMLQITACGGSDAVAGARGGGTAKNPDGFASWVILAGIDVDVHLRLALFNQRQGKQGCRQKKGPPPPRKSLAASRLLRCSLSYFS